MEPTQEPGPDEPTAAAGHEQPTAGDAGAAVVGDVDPVGPTAPEVDIGHGDVPAYAAVLERAQQVLADVERALERLEDGSYGTCEVCGTTIDDETLAEAPATATCRAHLPLAGHL